MKEIEHLENMARNVRRRIITTADHCHEKVHWASSLSCVEILLSIICDHSNISDSDIETQRRDSLIVSKGHAALAYYAVLEECGLLTQSFVPEYQKNGSRYPEELVKDEGMFIECSTGSLGLGLPFAVGLAIRNKRRGSRKRIFCVTGDGECNEGSNWEAIMLASQMGLDNLSLVVDRNGLQLDGSTESILDCTNLLNRLRAFGWFAHEADGHDFIALHDALRPEPGAPQAVIAHTVKGKGISFMENDFTWHDRKLSGNLLRMAKDEVGLE